MKPVAKLLSGLALTYGAIACSDSDKTPVSPDTHKVLASVKLAVHAANLTVAAPYDTMQLVVNAQAGDSSSISLDSITYTASDSTVTVGPTGLVTAHFATDAFSEPASVVVGVTYQGQTRYDTVRVQVMENVPAPGEPSLTLRPSPDSQAKAHPICDGRVVIPLCTNTQQPLFAHLSIGASDSLTLPSVSYRSADTTVASIDTFGVVTGIRPGRTTIYAVSYALGRVLRDSLLFTVTQTDRFRIGVTPEGTVGSETRYKFDADTIRITTGGVVVWEDTTASDSLDVIFEHPPGLVDSATVAGVTDIYSFFGAYTLGATGQGNIAPFAGDLARFAQETSNIHSPEEFTRASERYSKSAYRGRKFPTAGVYPFRSDRFHSRGTLLVCNDLC